MKMVYVGQSKAVAMKFPIALQVLSSILAKRIV